MRIGTRETVASAAVFAGIVLMLAWVDDRVRERFVTLVSVDGLRSLGGSLLELGEALAEAMRYQSLENAPLVVFTVVSAVLVVFMFRT